MWLTVFRRKAKARSTYHLPRKSCMWLPVKYMNFKIVLFDILHRILHDLIIAYTTFSSCSWMTAVVVCQITGVGVHLKSKYCTLSMSSKQHFQGKHFHKDWRKKGRAENEDVASNLGCRVAASSCCPTTPHASQGAEFWSKNAFSCFTECDKHEFKQQIYLGGKENSENWMWNWYSQRSSW